MGAFLVKPRLRIARKVLQPRIRAVGIVGGRVDHAVFGIVGSGEIFAVLVVEGEVEHLHSGASGVCKKGANVVGDEAEILGNDLGLGEGLKDLGEQRDAGGAVPFSVSRREFTPCYVLISRETSEMVYAQNVIEPEGISDALKPP